MTLLLMVGNGVGELLLDMTLLLMVGDGVEEAKEELEFTVVLIATIELESRGMLVLLLEAGIFVTEKAPTSEA